MSYRGDIRLGDTLDIKFTTRAFATGVPTTLSGSPAVAAYVGNSTTEITAGITLSVDFDSRTGLNNVRIVATSGNGYATATNIDLVITAGTVGGTSVVGEVVGSFSIECRSALMPTTAARTLDVTATGEAGIDWSNVGAPTTALDLSGTTIKTTQKVDVDTIKTNPVVNGGTTTFPTNATLASTTNITAGTITTVGTLTTYTGNTPQTGDSFARIGAAGAGLTAIDLPDQTMNITGNITGNLSGSVGSVTGAVGSVTGAVGSVTARVTANTDQIEGVDATNQIRDSVLSDATRFAGANVDAAITTRAAAATALSTVQWTNTRAGYLDNLNALKIKKNTALANFAFLMVLSADHITPATGLTVVVQRSIDGAAFGNATNTPATEVANGVYVISLSAADLNGDVVTLKMTSATADQRTIVIATEP